MEALQDGGTANLVAKLKDMHDTRQPVRAATGDPPLTDGSGIFSVEAKGWSEQTQTVGKNLARPNATANVVNDGMTWTYLGDGKWRAVGTYTGQYTGSYSGASVQSFDLGVLPAGVYTASSFKLEGSGVHLVRIGKGSTASYVIGSNYAEDISSCSFTADGTSNYYVAIGVDKTAHDGIYALMVEAGDTATSWEPYSGGVPGPNPSYPFPIEVCRGRNLIDWDSYYGAYKQNDEYHATSQTFMTHIPVPKELIGKTVVFSVYIDVPSNAANLRPLAHVGNTDINGSPNIASGSSGMSSVKFKPESENDFVCINYSTGGGITVAISQPQLELGSTPTPYVPYGHVGLEVNGRNLWGGEKLADDIVRIAGGTKSTANKTIEYSAIAVSNKHLFEYPFKANTAYTIILSLAGGSYSNMRVKYTDGTYVEVSTTVTTTDANKTVSRIVGVWASGNTKLNYEQCGLFEGVLTAADFEPYVHTTTPIPLPSKGFLGALPDGTKDTLAIDSAGGYEWTNETWEYNVTGSENVAASASVGTNMRARIDTLGTKVSPSNNGAGFCTHASFVGSFSQDTAHVYTSSDALYLFAAKSTAAAVVAAYAGATVLYPLATPTIESGYIDLPEIPRGATVTIPELDEVGVSYWIEGARPFVQHSNTTRDHVQAELDANAQDISALTQSLAGFLTRAEWSGDLNNAPMGAYLVNFSTCSNCPYDSGNGYVLTIGGLQFVIKAGYSMYIRYYNNQWGSWSIVVLEVPLTPQ